jgi:DNA polymerase-3 subunit gamma/tau
MAKKNSKGGEDADGAQATPEPRPSEADGQSALFGSEPGATPYVVLARKYRPENFADLIGQEAMVRTLKNAFATNRIAQGYMLTGVRGVGKTTTARILARALNYAKDGLPDRPTVDFDGYGVHCREIIASRHADVIEMDAASNTGVDNMREIIESARYKPILARYKVFIIDEVHMLSKGAFNALLKTLEEPPAHVKFIFATTEIRKVPVTVLSRCQRFDLRRVDVPVLTKHFEGIVAKEGAKAEPEALALIARAAEGSVRDGLSLLDQAIASCGTRASTTAGSGQVTSEAVRAMLGLADRGRIFDLVELMLGGKPGPAILALEALHKDGAEPVQVLSDLAECIHIASRIKAVGADAAGESLSAEEKRRATALAGQLSMPLLARAWQMLFKGIEETGRAGDQLAAAEMVLIRIAYTADLPSPDAVIRALGGGGGSGAPQRAGGGTQPGRGPLNADVSSPPGLARAFGGDADGVPAAMPSDVAARAALPDPRSLEEVADLAGAMRDIKLKMQIEDLVGLVRFEPGRLEISLPEDAPKGFTGELTEKLGKWTGRRWIVAVSRAQGATPIGHARRAAEAAEIERLKSHPSLKAVLDAFPDASIRAVRQVKQEGGE